jgi:Fur family ferric uptake transcriptional regulator
MDRQLPDFSSLRPPGGKRSIKRDRILAVFLRQEGHLSADELVERVHREDAKIGRATVYRTLQWMVDAGIARKVDFGEGRSRFEPSYRHPRHFHLVCTNCHQSSEFLSSDVESLLEEIAAARNFTPTQAVVQVYGTCDECRTGKKTRRSTARRPGSSSRATRCGWRSRPSAAASSSTPRRGHDQDKRGRTVFQKLAEEEKEHLGTLQRRYKVLLAKDPQLESRPTFLFFKGAASSLFASGAEELSKGVDDLEALRIGIKCERGSHEFFKKYGERFEDSRASRSSLNSPTRNATTATCSFASTTSCANG